MTRLEFAFQSDIGEVRPTNQDRILAKADILDGCSCGLFCVADGMGGLSDGHFASSLSVEILEKWWKNRLPEIKNNIDTSFIFEEFTHLFTKINEQILEKAKQDSTQIGTTCSLLFVLNDDYYIAHSGDTRIYAVQKKLIQNQITQLTEDHTWLVDQLKAGVYTEETVRTHPHRNRLTGCLGVFEKPRIAFSTGQVSKNSVFILATDGLYRNVNTKEMARHATRHTNIEYLVSELVNLSSKRGAVDNISVVAVNVKRGE